MTVHRHEDMPEETEVAEATAIGPPFRRIEDAVEAYSSGIEGRFEQFLHDPNQAAKLPSRPLSHEAQKQEIRKFAANSLHDFLSREGSSADPDTDADRAPAVPPSAGEARRMIAETAVNLPVGIIPPGMVKHNLRVYYRGIFERPASEAGTQAMNTHLLEYFGDRFPEIRLAQALELIFKTNNHQTMEKATKDLLTAYGMSLYSLVHAPMRRTVENHGL